MKPENSPNDPNTLGQNPGERIDNDLDASLTERIDATIIGGGIAGCWLFNLLTAQGYRVILCEADTLGCDQTLASQGMIHGGMKYALDGQLNSAAQAIASMPARWRACLGQLDRAHESPTSKMQNTSQDEGRNVDLSGLDVLAEQYFMFANRSTMGKLTTFFASRTLRGRIEKMSAELPAVFNDFDGIVYGLNDFVIDTSKLLQRLVAIAPQNVYQLKADASNIKVLQDGFKIQLDDQQIHSKYLINCSGNGSAPLISALGLAHQPVLKVQQRPLKQVVVKAKHNHQMFAHCLTGIASNEPRLTITSHLHREGFFNPGRCAKRGKHLVSGR